MKSISIILYHNCENVYFEECLERFEKQFFECAEIICIIDNPTGKLLETIKKYKNIKILYRGSESIRNIRNKALSVAEGKYVLAMDSDGLLTMRMLEKLWNICEEKKLDILYFSGTLFFEDKELEDRYWGCIDGYYRKGFYPDVMSGKELFVELQKNRDFKPVLALQIFRREFLQKEKIYFTENRIDEDEQFSLSAILCAEKAFCINDILYYRRIRNEFTLSKDGIIEDAPGYLKSLFLYEEHIKTLENTIKKQNDIIEKQRQMTMDYEIQIENLKKSNSYRIGKFVTYPVRIMKRVWKQLRK